MATFVPIRGTQAQINATPIVDGQMLIETDQGNFNKIYLDVNTTRYQVGGHSGGTGSTLVVTTSETALYGKSVNVVIDGTTYTGTFNASGTVVINGIVKVGNATVTSTDGTDTATNYVSMPYYGLYTIALSFFSATVNVTFPHSLGAICTLSDGTATLVATTSPMSFVVGNAGTWTATVTLDGVDKSDSTQITADGQVKSLTIEYGTINLTLANDFVTASSTITCTQGTTVINKTALSNSMTFYPPNTGNWTISGVIGSDTYYSSPNPVNVANLSTPVSADLQTVPDGSTVTPINNIQIWLNCAGIFDKTSYTTLDDVLSDNETLQKLISSDNAMNYLVRSKSWIGGNKALVPTMTSNNIPEGECFGSTPPYDASHTYFHAFDKDNTTFFATSQNPTNPHLGYKFTRSVIVNKLYIKNGQYITNVSQNIAVKGSNDGSTWQLITNLTLTDVSAYGENTLEFDNSNEYQYIAIFPLDTLEYWNVMELQFYSARGIIDDATAMRLIGKKNYASDTLLANSDWREGICDSEYIESVLNVSVPIMTDNTHPSGEAYADSNNARAYTAFDQASGDGWYPNEDNTNAYFGYKFPIKHKLYAAKIQIKNGSESRAFNFSIKASDNNGSSYDTLDSYSITGTSILSIQRNFNPSKEYDWYILDGVWWYSNFSGIKAQFYGREDVDETVYNIYSAADDTITVTPQGGGAAIPITTNNDGYGTIAKSSLPNGTYTFASSKAENPNNLGASDYYSKTINVFNGMIEACVMPDQCAYWYGWKDGCEIASTSNGWTPIGGSFTNPTFNTYDITLHGYAGLVTQAIVSKGQLKGSNVKAILKVGAGAAAENTNNGFNYAINKGAMSVGTAMSSTTYTTQSLNIGSVDNYYIYVYSYFNYDSYCQALWIE